MEKKFLPRKKAFIAIKKLRLKEAWFQEKKIANIFYKYF